MKRYLLVVLLVASCRGKETGGAPVGSASGATPAPTAGGWSVILSGKDLGLRDLSSNDKGTLIALPRDPAAPVTASGRNVVEASRERWAVLQIDASGTVTRGRAVPDVSSLDGELIGVGYVELGAKGAVVAFDTGAQTPIDGTVASVAHTPSTLWVSGGSWGSDDPLVEGKCNRKQYLARRTKETTEVVFCAMDWIAIELAAAGDDVIFCGSQVLSDLELGETKLKARSFLARIGADAKVKWARAINELGATRCEDVVVTSDGDIVAVGTAADNADFTEDAIAKKIQLKGEDSYSGSGNVGSSLWLARFAGDGTRRWARMIGATILGDDPTLAADRKGNAILATVSSGQLDLGHGPVGPKSDVVVATIDRDAKVTGLLPVKGDSSSPRAVVDSRDGLVLAFATSKSVSAGGMTVDAATPGEPSIGVIRVALPLPPP